MTVLRFLRREQATVSVGIEKVTEADILHVVRRISDSLGARINDYLCVAENAKDGTGRYWLLLATQPTEADMQAIDKLEQLVDRLFQEVNVEVRNSRADNRFLLRPRVLIGRTAQELIAKQRSRKDGYSLQEKQKVLLVGSHSVVTALRAAM